MIRALMFMTQAERDRIWAAVAAGQCPYPVNNMVPKLIADRLLGRKHLDGRVAGRPIPYPDTPTLAEHLRMGTAEAKRIGEVAHKAFMAALADEPPTTKYYARRGDSALGPYGRGFCRLASGAFITVDSDGEQFRVWPDGKTIRSTVEDCADNRWYKEVSETDALSLLDKGHTYGQSDSQAGAAGR